MKGIELEMKSKDDMKYISLICRNKRSRDRDYGALFANIEYAQEEYNTRKRFFTERYLLKSDTISCVEEFDNYGFLEYIVLDMNGLIVFQLKLEICK